MAERDDFDEIARRIEDAVVAGARPAPDDLAAMALCQKTSQGASLAGFARDTGQWQQSTYRIGPRKGQPCLRHLGTGRTKDLPQGQGQGQARAAYEPGKVYDVPLGDLHADPERFQYKAGVDREGVTAEMRSVRAWNPDFAGVVCAWLDPADGRAYVVNGHHRRELALRLGVPALATRFIDAPDARSARAVGALVNVAEGRGTPLDAALFLRENHVGVRDLEDRGVSLKGDLAGKAALLATLSDRQIDRLARGLLSEGRALDVSRHLADPARQDLLLDLLERRERSGAVTPSRVVEEMAREMALAPEQARVQRDLFGEVATFDPLFVERSEIKSYVRGELAREANDFRAVAGSRRARRLEGAGNVLSVAANRDLALHAERLRDVFDLLANRSGVISDAVNAAASELALANNRSARDEARKRSADAVRAACERQLAQAEPAGPASALGAGPGGGHPGGLFG